MQNNTFEKFRRRFEEMPSHACDFRARTGGMNSWILTEISSMEDNSEKQFCLQKFCRLFFANFFSLQKIPHVIYRKNKGDKKCLKKY